MAKYRFIGYPNAKRHMFYIPKLKTCRKPISLPFIKDKKRQETILELTDAEFGSLNLQYPGQWERIEEIKIIEEEREEDNNA